MTAAAAGVSGIGAGVLSEATKDVIGETGAKNAIEFMNFYVGPSALLGALGGSIPKLLRSRSLKKVRAQRAADFDKAIKARGAAHLLAGSVDSLEGDRVFKILDDLASADFELSPRQYVELEDAMGFHNDMAFARAFNPDSLALMVDQINLDLNAGRNIDYDKILLMLKGANTPNGKSHLLEQQLSALMRTSFFESVSSRDFIKQVSKLLGHDLFSLKLASLRSLLIILKRY